MSFGDAIRSGFSKYVTFSGRARRSEFWWFYLFSFLVIVSGAIIDAVAGTGPLLYALTVLGLFLPNLAVAIRRLHDLNKSGWSYLLVLIPLVGPIILIVFYCKDGTHGSNNYGPDPKGQAEQIGHNPDAVFS